MTEPVVPGEGRYRKKPVVIDARLFDGTNAAEVAEWCGGYINAARDLDDEPQWIEIQMLEGVMRANEGDWVIRGVKGEFYPCKPDIFAATYEPAESGASLPAPEPPEPWRKRAEEAERALGRSIELLLEVERRLAQENWGFLYNDIRVHLKQMEQEYASFGFRYPQSGPVINGLSGSGRRSQQSTHPRARGKP
jgi:hypothetical protein